MAFESLGLGARLLFDTGRAVQEMARASAGFMGLNRSVDQVSAGVSKVSAGFKQMTFSTAALTAGMAVGAKGAIDFEDQMGRVNAIIQPTEDQFAALQGQARKLGIVTVFSAKQAGSAMENLARAGFNVNEIMTAVPGVLAAAAAEGMDLGEAAQITASALRGMGLATEKSTHVANVLALASARTATTIVGLGEGMKFAAPVAAQYNVPLEELVASLGMLANAGLRGTLAGTAVKNMLLRLASPSDEILKLFGGREGFVNTMLDANGALLPMPQLIQEISKVVGNMPNILEKARVAEEMFGIRGETAFLALERAGRESMEGLVNELRKSSEGIGAAARMANARLDTVRGALTLLGASVEGFFIEIFSPFQKGMKEGIRDVTNVFNALILAIGNVREKGKADFAFIAKETGVKSKQILGFVEDTAAGFIQVERAVFSLIETLKPALEIIRGFMERLGPKGRRIFATFAVAAGAIIPVLGIIATSMFILGPLITGLIGIVSGLGSILLGALSPGILIIGAIIIAFKLLRKQGEGFLGWVKGTAQRVKGAFLEMKGGFLAGFMPLVGIIKESFEPALASLKETWNILSHAFKVGTSGVRRDWKGFGENLGMFIASFAEAAGTIVSFMSWLGTQVAIHLKPALDAFLWIGRAILEWVSGTRSFKNTLKNTFLGIAELVLSPVRAVATFVMDMLGKIAAMKIGRKILGVTEKEWKDSREWLDDLLSFTKKPTVLNEAAAAADQLSNASAKVASSLKDGAGEIKIAAKKLEDAKKPIPSPQVMPAAPPAPIFGKVIQPTEWEKVATRIRAVEEPMKTAAFIPSVRIPIPYPPPYPQPEGEQIAGASQPVTVVSKINIDGREFIRAVGSAQIDIRESQGERMPPSFRRRLFETGVG